MKIVNVISDPSIQILSFLIILISGEEFGGPFGMMLFMGLINVCGFSIIGLLGITMCLISHYVYRKWLQIGSVMLMIVSLIWFFLQPGGSYNYETFYTVLPILTLLWFFIVILFVAYKLLIIPIVRRK